MSTKRDLFEGALNSSDYFKSANNVKRRKYLKETIESSIKGVSVYVPPHHRNNKSEQETQGIILNYLRRMGAYAHKTKALNLVGSGDDMHLANTEVGVPDILCCFKGVFLALEVKAASTSAKVSGDQLRLIGDIRARGGFAFVIYSTEQVDLILRDTNNLTKHIDTPLSLTYKLYKRGYRY
jgi:Holliday junction resolvase